MDRGAVWRRFGAPQSQDGSVNEPRSQEACGVTWNERWRYANPEGGGWDRLVFWYRYDLRGVFRVWPDGAYEPEPAKPS
jgi:hypothetical protein